MTLKSGFFNSVDGDRLYDATDFTTYLEGLIVNGCLPNDTGFLVKPNPEPIGANPPSVIIGIGKAYYDGYWAHNTTEFVYALGTTQQVVSGVYYHIYLCFDISESGRSVTVAHVTGGPLTTIPEDTSEQFYMPLAIVADTLNVQPALSNIADVRWAAGVQGIGIVTESLTDKCVTIEKLSEYIVDENGKFIIPLSDGLIANSNIPDNEIGIEKLSDTTFLSEVTMNTSDAFSGNEELGDCTQRISYVAPANTKMRVDAIVMLDATLVTTAVTCTFYIKYREKIGTVWGAFTEVNWYVQTVNADDVYVCVPMIGVFDMTAGRTYEVAIYVTANGNGVVANRMRLFGQIGPR